MMIRLQAFSFAAIGRIAVSAIIMIATPTLAHAQSADLVLCDRLAALGDEDAKKALKRMECPYAIKDKRGNFVTNLCF